MSALVLSLVVLTCGSGLPTATAGAKVSTSTCGSGLPTATAGAKLSPSTCGSGLPTATAGAKLSASTCGSGLPTATIPDAVRAKVHAYLSTIDTPIPLSQWRSLGEPGVAALEEIARGKDALPSRRARAVGAAGLIGGDRARCLALEFVHKDPAPIVRQSAARALGEVLAPEELGSILQSVLGKDPALGVRAAAAQVLAAKAPASCAGIRDQVRKEPSSRRPAFSAALKRCAARR